MSVPTLTSGPDRGPGRDALGRFGPGNRFGRGHPNNRRMQALRQALIGAVTEEDITEVARKLVEDAKGGDIAATRVLLDHCLGRAPAALVVTGPEGEPLGMNWTQLQEVILGSLDPHPSARIAVAAALIEIDTAHARTPHPLPGPGPGPGPDDDHPRP
jgi:hypothetical protein